MNPNALLIENQLTTWLLRRTTASGVRRVASLSAALASDRGNVREENQDRAVIVRGKDRQGQNYALVAVADGIGGMQDGGSCAAIAIGAFIAALNLCAQNTDNNSNHPENWLRKAAYAANEAVFSKYRASGGSTLVALLIRTNFPPHWLSIGDSRVYCTNDKNLVQLSVDDTIAGQLGKNQENTNEQSQLLQFVGMGTDLEPHIAKLNDDTADTVILTTDGVHYLAPSPGWLGQIVHYSPEPGVCVKRLIDLAKWCGGTDNATVAMVTLPIDMQSEIRPSYPCLEVWDAYGELQIITSMSAKEILNHLADHTATTSFTPTLHTFTAPRLDAVTDQPPSLPILEKPKPSRVKSRRKPKKATGKQSENLDKLIEVDSPQLHMEFPKKSK